MEILFIEAGKQTPEITFDSEKGVFKIKGKSYPENVNIFYQQVFNYIEEYKKSPQAKTKLEFNWLYYNTATNKIIVRLIMLLKDTNTELEVDWCYNEGFDVIKEKGEELAEILDVPIYIKQN